MNENTNASNTKLPSGTPKWVLISCVLVTSVIIPLCVALSPQLSDLVKGAIEARKDQAANERTALGTVLEMLSTNSKQIYVLSAALEAEQVEKKSLTERVSELEKADALKDVKLSGCLERLKTCR